MCDMTLFFVSIALVYVTVLDLSKVFIDNILLKFGICILLVVGNGSTFIGIFIHMAKALNIRLCKASKRSHRRWAWNVFIIF